MQPIQSKVHEFVFYYRFLSGMDHIPLSLVDWSERQFALDKHCQTVSQGKVRKGFDASRIQAAFVKKVGFKVVK